MKEMLEYDELIEQVVEWLGNQWRRCQIRAELKKITGTAPSPKTLDGVIELARDRIRKRLKIDPDEFRGYSLEFYSSIIRDKHASIKYKLHAQLRIDKLLGLETVSLEDPHAYAEALRNAIMAMDGGVPKIPVEAAKEEVATPEPEKDLSEEVATVESFLREAVHNAD